MLTRNLLRHRTVELSDEERGMIDGLVLRPYTLDPDQVAVHQGQALTSSTLLVEGFMTRHLDAADGRRHLIGLHVPGDFVDLHGLLRKYLEHDVGTLTQVTLAVIPHASLRQFLEACPHIARRLRFYTMLDAAMHRQCAFRLTALNARQRVAHSLCEMHARLLPIEAVSAGQFRLPMTQSAVGEICSFSNVHVSRVLRELREMRLCEMKSFNVQILDLHGLRTEAVFDAAYHFLDSQTNTRAMGQLGMQHE